MKSILYDRFKTVVFIALFTLTDQVTKYLATKYLVHQSKEVIIIKNILSLQYLRGGNSGAAWGFLSGETPILVIVSVLIITLFGLFLRNINAMIQNNDLLNRKRMVLMKYLFSLLLAGALGNIIDRIIKGYVVDFICFRFIDFPIFNLSDIYITISSVFIIILSLFFLDKQEFDMIFSIKKVSQK